MTDYRDLIPVIVEREHAILPEGFDSWGIKSVRADLKTHGGYQWPYPGNVATASDVDLTNTGACPRRKGDGLCVTSTWEGMASGGIPARTLLLVAFRASEVLGRDDDAGKLRTSSVAVVSLVDGDRLLQQKGTKANLFRANLKECKQADLALAMTSHLPEGPLIGWKKCMDGVIVKLQIPEKARRSHGASRKCRAEYVTVLEVFGAEKGVSIHDKVTEYHPGKTVKANGWCEDRWETCAMGIHFFISRLEAEAFSM